MGVQEVHIHEISVLYVHAEIWGLCVQLPPYCFLCDPTLLAFKLLCLSRKVTSFKNGPDQLPWLKNSNKDNMVVMLLLIMIAVTYQAPAMFLVTAMSNFSPYPWACAGTSKPSTF